MTDRMEWDATLAATLIDELADRPGATLPILHRLLDTFGYIHQDAIPLIATRLNISRAEVVGVVHYYHDFRTEPPGKHVLRLCRAEACQSMGGEAVVEHVAARLAVPVGGTTSDGDVTLESVYCLGNCALSPSAMLDGRVYGRFTPARADAVLSQVLA